MFLRWFHCIACASSLVVPAARAQFTDVTVQAGVDYLQWNAPADHDGTLRMTGGAAAGDVDGDGYPDLFVTRLDAPDILFRNDGRGRFVDVSQASGFQATLPSNGAAMGDVDNDGDVDLYVTSVGDQRHYLYVNDGSGRFTEEGILRNAAIATDDRHIGMSAAFGDYDRDGYLDMHVTEWGNATYEPNEPRELRSHARVLRNVGVNNPGYFVDTTLQSGIYLDNSVGYGVNQSVEGVWRFTSTFADFDRDGHADLAIAGDFHTSELYWNNGDGTFTLAPGPDKTNPSGIGTDENGMGSAVGDFNGDGLLDWFVTSIFDPADPCHGGQCNWNSSGNRLYLNNGDRTFTDVTDASGVRDGGWGWGTAFLDYDNDADLDLVMTNGMVSNNQFAERFAADPVKLWRNDGAGTFTEVARDEGLIDTGSGKGLLTFDYDLDGDLDLFIVNNGAHPKLYRNDSEQGNAYLKVRTQGIQSNRDGIGAFVTLIADLDGPAQTRYVTAGGVNFLSQSDLTVHFGLGQREEPVHQLIIDWPSGIKQVISNVAINTSVHAIEPVPEPTSAAILLLGAIGFLIPPRRTRNSRPWGQGPCVRTELDLAVIYENFANSLTPIEYGL